MFVSNLSFLCLAFEELKEAQAEELQGVTGPPVVQAQMLSQIMFEQGAATVWLSHILVGGPCCEQLAV